MSTLIDDLEGLVFIFSYKRVVKVRLSIVLTRDLMTKINDNSIVVVTLPFTAVTLRGLVLTFRHRRHEL